MSRQYRTDVRASDVRPFSHDVDVFRRGAQGSPLNLSLYSLLQKDITKIQHARRKGKRSVTRSDAEISTVLIDSTDRHADGNRLSGIGMPITKSSRNECLVSNLWIVAHVIRMTKVRCLLCGLLTQIYNSQFSISIILSVTITTTTNTTMRNITLSDLIHTVEKHHTCEGTKTLTSVPFDEVSDDEETCNEPFSSTTFSRSVNCMVLLREGNMCEPCRKLDVSIKSRERANQKRDFLLRVVKGNCTILLI